MRLRKFAALAGVLVLTLGVVGAVNADSGSPTTIQAQVSGNTVTVHGDWGWDKCTGKKIVGWAVAWGDPSWASNPVPKSGGGSYFMGDAAQDNTVFTTGDPCTGTSGAWGPVSHTYDGPGTYTVCVIVYDIVKNKDGSYPVGKHGVLAGGDDRNIDNSVEENDLEGQSICLSPEIPVVVETQPRIYIQKTASVTELPEGGGAVTYTYLVWNVGNVPLTDVTVVDDKCTAVTGPTGDTGADKILGLTEKWTYTCLTTLTATTKNVGTATGYAGDVKTIDAAEWTVTVLGGGVQGETSEPTAPPTDGIATQTTDAGGSLPLLLIVLGIIGLGAVVLTPARAKR